MLIGTTAYGGMSKIKVCSGHMEMCKTKGYCGLTAVRLIIKGCFGPTVFSTRRGCYGPTAV